MISFDQVAEWAMAFVVGGGVTAVGAKRLLKDYTLTGAETSLVGQLRKEVERLGEQNTRLSKTLDDMQQTVFALRDENFKIKQALEDLKDENQELRDLLAGKHAGLNSSED